MIDWGDRWHWDITIGRLNVSRWCRVTEGRATHPITVKLWNRVGSARFN